LNVKPYFDAVRPVLGAMLAENPIHRWCRPPTWKWSWGYDGWLLYTILQKAFGPPPPAKALHIPTNGIHLRRIRSGQEIPDWLVRVGIIQRAHALLVSTLGQGLIQASPRPHRRQWESAITRFAEAICGHGNGSR
jgi:hypothetical protein